MKVAMETPEKVHTYSQNIGRDTTAHSIQDSQRTREQNGFTLDISGTVMDNNAYGGHGDRNVHGDRTVHGRTAEDVSREAGQQDVASRRNYMAIMSNTMSEEDFAKLQEEGVHPGNVEVETVVTIVDHIKAAIVQGGSEVIGYTDDLDTAKLEQITGNKVLAQDLAKQFAAHDIPVNQENAKAANKAFEKAREITELSEGATKFMVENKLPPTIENLYLAQFSGGSDAGKQGKGYYAQDTGGYYAKKADEYNWEALEGQMKKVISEAGYEVNEDALADSKWLIEKGIPLTKENFTALQQLQDLQLPQTMEEITKAIAAAIADGKNPLAANMQDNQSYLEKAVEYTVEIAEIEPQTIDVVLSKKQMLNMKNLLAAKRQEHSKPVPENTTGEAVTAKRQLEEIRLKMTVEANLKLLRSGISIDTMPLEQLVNELKEEEASFHFSLYQETVTKVDEISAMPAALIGRMAIADVEDLTTLNGIHERGTVLKSAYEKAEETYEAVMTAPRRDMGDSIRKAFRNVDDILEDRNLEVNESNRRAIRILGYNSMELTDENIEAVKEKDNLLNDVISKMKPGTVLEMIREKVNPLTMSLEELKTYLSGKETTVAEEMEDYSRFLFKLEQKNGITEQERSAYIGVYRLLRQVEKSDSAVVGAMVNAEMEFSMGNLLTAIRSSKKQGMDVTVNDNFGGVSAKPSKEDLKEIMASLESKEADEAYVKEQVKEVQTLKNTEDAVIRSLLNHNQPVTWNQLMAAAGMMKYPGMLYKKTDELAKQTGKEKVLKEDIENLYEKFTDAESAKEAYQQLQNTMTDIVTGAADQEQVKAIDVKELSRMCRQISLATSFAKEEQYEIPVEIDGELTTINLRFVHNASEGGKVTATIASEEMGKVACEFKITDGTLSGYIVCSQKEGLEKLKQSEDVLADMLDTPVENISFIQSKKLDLHHFSEGQNETEKVSTKELYMAAKAFIGYFQRIS